MNRLSTRKRTLVLKLLIEGNSIRGIARITGVSKTTILRLLDTVGRVCAKYQDKYLCDLPCRVMQADEIWSFIYAKQKNVPYAMAPPKHAGDVWTWVVMCADTKLIPVWRVGNRKAGVGRSLMRDLEPRLRYRVQLTTDGHSPYLEAVEEAFGSEVDYGRIVKNYSVKGKDDRDGTDFVSMYRVEGRPDPVHISTSYVERQNLTMRTSMRRFSRRTNAHSKTRRNHKRMVALYFMHYNFCRMHESLGVTPAMEAGITDTLWDESDIVELIDQATPAPGPRGPYNTAKRRQRERMGEEQLGGASVAGRYCGPERRLNWPEGEHRGQSDFGCRHDRWTNSGCLLCSGFVVCGLLVHVRGGLVSNSSHPRHYCYHRGLLLDFLTNFEGQ